MQCIIKSGWVLLYCFMHGALSFTHVVRRDSAHYKCIYYSYYLDLDRCGAVWFAMKCTFVK